MWKENHPLNACVFYYLLSSWKCPTNVRRFWIWIVYITKLYQIFRRMRPWTSEPLLIRSVSTNYWTSYLPERSQSTPSAGSAPTYEDARRMWSLEKPSPLFAKREKVYRKEVSCHPSCSTPTCLDCQHHLTASNSHRTRTPARHTRQGLLFPRFVRSWTATWLPCMNGLRSMIWNSLLASPRQQSSPPSVRKWACHCRLKSDSIQYRPRRTRRYWESPWTAFTHSTPTPTTLSTK